MKLVHIPAGQDGKRRLGHGGLVAGRGPGGLQVDKEWTPKKGPGVYTKVTPEKEPGHRHGGRMLIAEIVSTRGAGLDRDDGMLIAKVGISDTTMITSAPCCGSCRGRKKISQNFIWGQLWGQFEKTKSHNCKILSMLSIQCG